LSNSQLLLDTYFKSRNIVSHNLKSFDEFVENGLREVVAESISFKPDIIPNFLDVLEIKFGSIWIDEPSFKEADSSVHKLTPMEARIRDLTYAAPVFLEVIKVENGVEKGKENIHIGDIPIMVKSKYCILNGKTKEELIEMGEDPSDPGGYFIINGTERVIVVIEDLAQNKLFVEKQKTGPYPVVGKVFSEGGNYRIPHSFEKGKDGMVYVSFTRVDKIPFVVLMKALGIERDKEIIDLIGSEPEFQSDFYINLYEASGIKTQADALDSIGKRLKIIQDKPKRVKRVKDLLDKFFLPHIGNDENSRLFKAYFLARVIRKVLLINYNKLPEDDKDHYSNKRLRLPGDMLKSLFRFVFSMLVSDMKYNFERLVKRGKYPTVQAVCRDKLLTSRIKSALATGEWVGGRHGVSQHIMRNNFFDSVSHLRRVVSLLTAVRENFEARDLHPTHWGKLCTSETPEGQSIGLRKNLAITCEISTDPKITDEELIKKFKDFGLKEGL